MSRFQVYKNAKGKFRFRLRAANNKIVAVGEAYAQRAGCINGIRSIQRNRGAEIEDLTINGPNIPNPKYQIYKNAKGEFRFRLKAPNGEIIAEGEGYESKESCLSGIEVVRGSGEAEIEDLSVTKKVVRGKVSGKMEESASSPKTDLEGLTETKKADEVEDNEAKLEAPLVPANLVTKVGAGPVLAEVKVEELPQNAPVLPVEAEIPESFPVETKLELYAIPQSVNKRTNVTITGKLSASKSGRGIPGAKIRIYDRGRPILGDDFLCCGATGDDGLFTVVWKARPLSWRKSNGNIYAKFAGNEKAKPAKSDIKTISIT